MMLLQYYFLIFFKKGICCGYSSELPRLVKAIQMSSHNICCYKDVDKNTLTVHERLLNCFTVSL